MAESKPGPRAVRVAIEGCGHGTLNAIYASVSESCKLMGWTGVDVLIIGGDFQAVRNPKDLNCMSVPANFRQLADFFEYYSGARTAPFLTLFVGGNHEASNYLSELYFGGWVAPNIYYLGAANVVRLGGLRIAGLSGIWKGYDYNKSHFERIPYNQDDAKSVYHVREIDVRRLLQIKTQVDVGISHDWPKGVEWLGNWNALFRKKDHLEADARSGRLGSEAAKQVMARLRPGHWFSAHLHIKYAANVQHKQAVDGDADDQVQNGANVEAPSEIIKNEAEIDLDLDDEPVDSAPNAPPTTNADEIDLDLEDEAKPDENQKSDAQAAVSEDLRAQLPASFAAPPVPAGLHFPKDITNATTQFLALDKCLPKRDFLQMLEIPLPTTTLTDASAPLSFEYDPEFLAITRALSEAHNEPGQNAYYTYGNRSATKPPDRGEAFYAPLIEEAEAWIAHNCPDLTIPQNFEQTAPPWDNSMGNWRKIHDQPREYTNSQTSTYCALIGIDNPFAITDEDALARLAAGPEESGQGGWRGGRGGRGRRGRGGFGRGGGRGRRGG